MEGPFSRRVGLHNAVVYSLQQVVSETRLEVISSAATTTSDRLRGSSDRSFVVAAGGSVSEHCRLETTTLSYR